MNPTRKLFLKFLPLIAILFFFSCKKTDFSTTTISDQSNLEAKFFNANRSASTKENMVVDFLKRKNDADSFVRTTISRIGYPRWDKALTRSKVNNRGNVMMDSLETFYIPFVRESENFVNAAMVVKVSATDTTFFYRSDWEYARLQNETTEISDDAEIFAIFFMTLDKAVFGSTKFKILDSNLFRRGDHRAEQVRLDSVPFIPVNSLLTTVEYCQDVAISINDCPEPPGLCMGAGGTCDHCPICTSSIQYTYCWEGVVDIPSGGGGTGGSGGGSGDGGSTPPPPCGEPTEGRGNEPCHPGGGGGGWTPVPIGDVEDPYEVPVKFTSLDYSQVTDPCLAGLIDDMGASTHSTVLLKAYYDEHISASGVQQKISAKYVEDYTITNASGTPIPATSQVDVLPDGTNQVTIFVNPTLLTSTTKEYVASILLHEMLHGIITVIQPSLTIFGDLPATSIRQHKAMYNSGVANAIGDALNELYPSMDPHDAKALAVYPLTDAYWNSNTGTYAIGAETKCITYYSQTLGNVITQAQKFKNATPGSGTPYCP